MRWALSYAAQQSSGLETFPRDPDHIEKGFIFGGMPARSGVTAVLLVHNGWTAVHDVRWSGPRVSSPPNAPAGKAELLVDRLGERYEITRANIKRWTVGFPIHAPLDAIEALLKRQPIDPERVQELVVRYQPGSITDNSGPSDINVQHALAVMLIDRRLTFKSIHDTGPGCAIPPLSACAARCVWSQRRPAARCPRSCSSPWPTATASSRMASGRCWARPPIRCRASSSWPSAVR